MQCGAWDPTMSKRNELKARIHYVVLHSLLIVVGDAPGQRPACPERLPLASCNSYSRTVWRNTQRGCVVTQSQGMGHRSKNDKIIWFFDLACGFVPWVVE